MGSARVQTAWAWGRSSPYIKWHRVRVRAGCRVYGSCRCRKMGLEAMAGLQTVGCGSCPRVGDPISDRGRVVACLRSLLVRVGPSAGFLDSPYCTPRLCNSSRLVCTVLLTASSLWQPVSPNCKQHLVQRGFNPHSRWRRHGLELGHGLTL